MAQQPSIPKGTRDFSPQEMAKRNYIFDTIKDVFKLFGFSQIETPAMENLSSLMGKYGEEGDKLLFKVLNSGDYLKKVSAEELSAADSGNMVSKISEKGLRYDLTVPFARYVVQHRNDIQFPFKRYQIQPVWRADRPQKGRYREFFQCDADVVGSNSLMNEVEIIQMLDKVFTKLDINVIIKINNRKILAGIAESIGYPEKLIDITVAMDKIDKIGPDAVYDELRTKGIDNDAIQMLEPFMNLQGNDTNQKMNCLREFIGESAIGNKGMLEVEEVFDRLKAFDIKNEVELDLTLARGLSYYTGAIFEVISKDIKFGSISGGGRYDDLTGVFGLKDVSGVGISFGADRIYDVLTELDKFPKTSLTGTEVLIINFGEKEESKAIQILSKLRDAGIHSELFPETAKMKKQMKYANHNNIQYVILAGEDELESGKLGLKVMETGEQENLNIDDIIKKLQK
ncbi:MAG: histidine--tRNA ligase [Bacteroidetes bacterium]|nr:MAG: histidine--tRNA ligase [Bacteroidota bacterium]